MKFLPLSIAAAICLSIQPMASAQPEQPKAGTCESSMNSLSSMWRLLDSAVAPSRPVYVFDKTTIDIVMQFEPKFLADAEKRCPANIYNRLQQNSKATWDRLRTRILLAPPDRYSP